MSNSSCKYCGEENLHWHFNIATKKHELWDARDNRHRCRPNNKMLNQKEYPENKAWKELKARLDKEGKKVYYIKK